VAKVGVVKRRDGEATRRRILDAAITLFGIKGFRGTSVADICAAAKANIAAVNYYFGDKASLYQEAWSAAYQDALNADPIAAEHDEERPPAARLHQHVRSLIMRTAGIGPAGRLQLLRQAEHRTPTGLLAKLQRRIQGPMREHMLSVLRQLAPRLSQDELEMCELSILAQTRAVAPLARETYEAMAGRTIDEALLDRYADHVCRFSIAALIALNEKPVQS